MTREDWLNRLSKLVIAEMRMRGIETPKKYRVSCGWPAVGALSERNRRIGECWSDRASKDGHFEIFISPVLSDTNEVAETLAHELVHACVGTEAGHGKKFQAVAKKIGFTKPFASTPPTPDFDAWMTPLLEKIGDYPHGQLAPTRKRKKQGTRMLKCECGACGYTVRITRKWLDDVGLPHCPNHGEMDLA